jgi:hypothetical protein
MRYVSKKETLSEAFILKPIKLHFRLCRIAKKLVIKRGGGGFDVSEITTKKLCRHQFFCDPLTLDGWIALLTLNPKW